MKKKGLHKKLINPRAIMLDVMAKLALLAMGAAFIAASAGCAVVFNAMSRDFSAETGYVGTSAQQQYENSNEIKIISANLAHCRGPYDFYGDGRHLDELDMDLTINSPEQVYKCLDDFAEMFMREDADIVLLQEADKNAVWSYGIDFVPYLAQKAGMDYYAYGSKYDFVWWPYEHQRANGQWIDTLYFDIGNGIISKYPILTAGNKPFGEQDFVGWIAGEERYIDARISINGRQARFISTHFGAGEIESRLMIEEAKKAGMPLVFGGTLHLVTPAALEANPSLSWCSANAMRILDDSGLFSIYMLGIDPLDRTYYTSDTQNLYWTADYIIPTNDFAITDYHVIDAELSDHKPVSATLVFNELK
ncbi:MAG: hypothetical protein PHO02_01745 [Candidatus Nanoarchaeia archaeon]|nr:hypothetical protein [Candidatus Nanoarchaeia archaeon]